MTTYTAISFAPVQGFIEKSRKLRDLYGASQILSYLSWHIVKRAKKQGVKVISPALDPDAYTFDIANMDIVQGMPNRILLEGEFSCNDAKSAVAKGWAEIITTCRGWIQEQLAEDFTFSDESWGRAWTKWKINAWEVFWGTGTTIDEAMRDLETRKLRRDWAVPNWNGESSSLSGTDAIAYPNIDSEDNVGAKYNEGRERIETEKFYKRLAEVLDPTGQENDHAYINENEQLSIPELIKRLITYEAIANEIHRDLYTPSFREMLREGYWTGWFMGDGDKVGDFLKTLTAREVSTFSYHLRSWGKVFQREFKLGRVVYAGGDDFLGVIYGTNEYPQRTGQEAIASLHETYIKWERLREDLSQAGLSLNDENLRKRFTLSLGFVWAGHRVPQRDVLQHCREAEKRAKNLGRDRVTIRIVFNNGQFVEWTTPWKYLAWLGDYCDRNDRTGKDANWSHIYSDLAQLKARHAIPPRTAQNPDDSIALHLFGLYFGNDKQEVLSRDREQITGTEDTSSVIEWIEGMIQVGWHLCSNS